MKQLLIVAASILLLGNAASAIAQTSTSASATQNSAATSTAQGTIQFSQEPEHTTQTVRNVSAPVLGAYAASFSQMNCGQTVQFGGAIAGVSVVGGASHSLLDCKLEVAAAETVRQATVTEDATTKANLQKAAILIRCQVSAEVYDAYRAAGFDCSLKPAELQSRTDTQPPSTRIASGN
ncbi:hypothetical protein ACFSHT_15705 [Paraburkholderia silviterrae]|uniref:Uncharacterized protein n=1 Tax=Paraburkholderia silviterrae TaxID=2528715 RepID=A0A4R5MA87_9BURK|nr:hypothetical protein [Paraburkholderia silviterrae]TDG23261.1 hypothetical protein EYW47_15125 [Paraburkholderia silviterrae]